MMNVNVVANGSNNLQIFRNGNGNAYWILILPDLRECKKVKQKIDSVLLFEKVSLFKAVKFAHNYNRTGFFGLMLLIA